MASAKGRTPLLDLPRLEDEMLAKLMNGNVFLLLALIASLALPGCITYPGDDPASHSSGSIDSAGAASFQGQMDFHIPEGQLTAGEWTDTDNWTFWKELSTSGDYPEILELWGIEPRYRVVVDVRDASSNNPIVDAVITLKDESGATLWVSRSRNTGRAIVYLRSFIEEATQEEVEDPSLAVDLEAEILAQSYQVVVESGTASESFIIDDPADDLHYEVSLSNAPRPPQALDLMLMVDTTGSMGDELEYFQAELRNVIRRVSEKHEDLDVRISVNFYRDQGDEYVVRSFPFTSVEEAERQLLTQEAAGGGDGPEAVHTALSDALHNHSWSEAATARILIQVADAPPRPDNENVIAEMRNLLKDCSQQGVQFIGVSGSGIDRATEALMRLYAMHTNGTYVFLTDDSGIGEAHLDSSTVGEHQVEFLNDLLVRVVDERVRLDQQAVALLTEI